MKKLFVIMLVAILSLVLVATASAVEKVTICHASGQAGTTKFETLTIAWPAVYGEGGHFYENGTPRAGHEDDYLGACIAPTPTATEVVEPTPTEVVEPTPTATEVVEPTPTSTDVGKPTPTSTDVVEPTPTEVVEPTPTATPKPKKPPETGGGDVSALFVVLMSSVGGAALYFGARWSKKEM